MDPEYKKYLDSSGIKKNHIIKIVVREVSSEIPQKGGTLLWSNRSKGYGSMHAVIKAIYTVLPNYRGKRIFVEVKNETNGMFAVSSHHYVPLNRIPLKL